MEGPFFAESKKGAQNPAHLRNPDFEMFLRLKEAAGDLQIIADVAPELPGGIEYVEKVSKLCRVSLRTPPLTMTPPAPPLPPAPAT